MDAWMNGRTDRKMDGWMDGWMDRLHIHVSGDLIQ